MANEVLSRKARQQRTVVDLLDAAERVFLAEGYHATTIAKIASEAGYTHGAVYANFEGKDALCMAVIERVIEAQMTNLEERLSKVAGDAEAALRVVEEWWQGLIQHEGLLVFALEFSLAAMRSDRAEELRDHVRAGKKLIEAALAMTVDPDSLPLPLPDAAAITFVLGVGLGFDHAVDPEQPFERFAPALRALLSAPADPA
ncbi:MAG TPA: TetR/AcrR family transcriptional regulator [Nocardioidaceae bacterium]|nr:TetR/AcrR family transcriptional regulator [Nocardioidaceae bacterium]